MYTLQICNSLLTVEHTHQLYRLDNSPVRLQSFYMILRRRHRPIGLVDCLCCIIRGIDVKNLKIKTTTLMCLSSAKQHQFTSQYIKLPVLANITYGPCHSS